VTVVSRCVSLYMSSFYCDRRNIYTKHCKALAGEPECVRPRAAADIKRSPTFCRAGTQKLNEVLVRLARVPRGFTGLISCVPIGLGNRASTPAPAELSVVPCPSISREARSGSAATPGHAMARNQVRPALPMASVPKAIVET
jgi:hypothetical protein